MTWHIEWDDRARKELRSLDKPIQKKILTYLRERTTENPINFGKELSGDKVGLWRYRIENYRLICQLENDRLRISPNAYIGYRCWTPKRNLSTPIRDYNCKLFEFNF